MKFERLDGTWLRSPATGGLLVILGALFLAGCRQTDTVPGQPFYPEGPIPFQQDPAEREAVLALLDTLDLGALRGAFDRLSAYAYTQYTRTEQFDRENYLVAYREVELRVEPEEPQPVITVQDVDSAGAFDFGFFRRFVSTTVDRQAPQDITPYIIPEDPPYLTSRNYDAFLYRFMPDTLMWDTAARVIEVRAMPESGDGQNIRRVRLYVDRNTSQLIGILLERIDLALLFREESRFYLHIRRATDGTWLPYNSRFETRIMMPFRPPHLFRTTATYYDVQRPG